MGANPTATSQFLIRKRKYLLNEKFFDEWSPKMAYVLGFWFADGYMRHEKSYRIVFSSRDYHPLLQIKKCFGCNYSISQDQRPDGIDYQLILYSKHLFQRLIALGGVRGKSKKGRLPPIPLIKVLHGN